MITPWRKKYMKERKERQTFGHEVEGLVDRSLENSRCQVVHDGSVTVGGGDNECDGSCRDDCECSSYCECSECERCDYCDHIIEDCSCSECLVCSNCDNTIDDCSCNPCDFNSSCTCTEGNIREACETAYANRPTHYRCDEHYNDCQLDCGCECSCSCNCEGDMMDGELVSPILSYTTSAEWLRTYKPEQTNSTCGYHLTLGGLTLKEYGQLMTRDFYRYLLKCLTRWGHACKINQDSQFWMRMEGGNTYCAKKWFASQQVRMTHKGSERYAHINFNWSLDGTPEEGGRKTVEFRLMPAFQKHELRVKAFYALTGIVNAYLSRKHSNPTHIVEFVP